MGKFLRAAARRTERSKPLSREPRRFWYGTRLLTIAGESLAMPEDGIDAALKTFTGENPNPDSDDRELLDALMLRSLDTLNVLGFEYFGQSDVRASRTKLIEKRGESWADAIRQIGSASAAAQRLLSVLGPLLTLCLLLVRIRYTSGNSPRFPRAAYHHPQGWIRSSGRFGVFARRSTSRFNSSIGCARAAGSSGARGSALSWCSFGARGAFALGGYRRAIRTSRSSFRTVGSSARRTSSAAVAP